MNATRALCRYTTLTALLIAAATGSVEAQQFVCWPIARGDTVTALAERLTGSAASRDAQWFQIRDPARQSFVPKSQYERLSTSWQACVARDMLTSAADRRSPDQVPQRYDTRLASLVGVSVSLILFAASAAGTFAAARRIPPDMQQAGEKFVDAFARPLIDPSSEVAPIEARFHFVPEVEQLEIFIAPTTAGRYPNLSDHKKNVEYDVGRVARLLRPDFIVGDRLRARGKWVVVPIRRADIGVAQVQRQAGVT